MDSLIICPIWTVFPVTWSDPLSFPRSPCGRISHASCHTILHFLSCSSSLQSCKICVSLTRHTLRKNRVSMAQDVQSLDFFFFFFKTPQHSLISIIHGWHSFRKLYHTDLCSRWLVTLSPNTDNIAKTCHAATDTHTKQHDDTVTQLTQETHRECSYQNSCRNVSNCKSQLGES